jgi:hypothetical protein
MIESSYSSLYLSHTLLPKSLVILDANNICVTFLCSAQLKNALCRKPARLFDWLCGLLPISSPVVKIVAFKNSGLVSKTKKKNLAFHLSLKPKRAETF